ncbi:MAG TPA: hypothetical protein VL461_00635 [Dictyobacter sp.]|jgi:hypothetical protein|nr:hypothetical protein [Dictyobacter sp.]
MTFPNTRAQAEHQMQQKWYELVQAEQIGATQQTLEHFYHAYLLAVEDYQQYLQIAQPTTSQPSGSLSPTVTSYRQKL